MTYSVVIPTAGLGSRIGKHTKFYNKALVSIGDMPAICHVIEKFPTAKSFVILLGYRGDMVKEVIEQFYPSKDITFVNVDPFEGPGSGLGYTLLQAEQYLQQPFIFVPNDTIIGSEKVDHDPSAHGNWAGYYYKCDDDSYSTENFRTIVIEDCGSKVGNITGKGTLNPNIYIGLCGIKDYKEFWDGMHQEHSIEEGEVVGLANLDDLSAIEVQEWYDTGSFENLEVAKEKFRNPDVNILEKEDEAIWFYKDQVIKFSIHTDFILDRVKRLNSLPSRLMPKLMKSGSYTYKYKKVEGSVIADSLTESRLQDLLSQCNDAMWSKKIEADKEAIKTCYKFYRDKTYDRLKHYISRFEEFDDPKIINGKSVKSVISMLDDIDWKELCESPHWSLYHGDFHGENIIANLNAGFTLLDWRQRFGQDSIDYGDAYYDFAKLRHGLLVNHGVVSKDGFNIREFSHNYYFISIAQHSNLIECDLAFKRWLTEHNFDINRVDVLTALIYINICGLHEYPYAKFLYLYGQKLLSDYLYQG